MGSNVKKDFAFIIPCRNLENYIDPLLESFSKLYTFGLYIEYIFVLDDCQDKTEEKIKQNMKKFPYQILHCNVHSCGLARNIGLENSNSDFVWFVDGDDWLLQINFLPQLIKNMRINNIPIIRLQYDSNDKFLLNILHGTVWQYIFKREAIGNIRFGAQQPTEDCRFTKKVLEKNNLNYQSVIKLNDRPYYYYNYNRLGSNMYQIYHNGKIE